MVGQIPLSILIFSFAAAVAFARMKQPKRALRLLCIVVAVLAFVWCMLAMHVYTLYVLPEH
jgi:uncharacterized membrane protein YjjB (DUF3815 family)